MRTSSFNLADYELGTIDLHLENGRLRGVVDSLTRDHDKLRETCEELQALCKAQKAELDRIAALTKTPREHVEREPL